MLLLLLLVLKLLKPVAHNLDLLVVHINNLRRGQARLRLGIGAKARLVPVMHAPVNELKGLLGRRRAAREADGVAAGRAPRILGAVDDGQPRVAEVEAAVLVDVVHLRARGDVEVEPARVRAVLGREGARHHGPDVFGRRGSVEVVSPSGRLVR